MDNINFNLYYLICYELYFFQWFCYGQVLNQVFYVSLLIFFEQQCNNEQKYYFFEWQLGCIC